MLLQPYPGRNISEEDAIFNYHVSQARLVIEKYFGIIARSWRNTNSAAYCPNPLLTIMIAQVKSKKANGKHW